MNVGLSEGGREGGPLSALASHFLALSVSLSPTHSANARTKGLFILPDPRISEVQLKKSNLSKVVFLEAKDGTRSHVKGFGIYSYFSGFKVGPKLA